MGTNIVSNKEHLIFLITACKFAVVCYVCNVMCFGTCFSLSTACCVSFRDLNWFISPSTLIQLKVRSLTTC